MANLLNTNTVNFQDLLANGRSYHVPHISEITRGLRSSGKIYGSILGLAIIDRLAKLQSDPSANSERAAALRSRYIGEKDPASLTEISKLTLNSHDNGFFQDYLVQLRRPLNPRSLPKSNRLLWDCFTYFEKRILAEESIVEDGLQLAELLSEVIARRLLFILITVDDEISAYTVFETLNARGLELTTTDLLKNYLFSRLRSPSDLESVQRRWERLVATVRQERFGEFLRYHYLTKQRQIRSGRLFKIVRDEVKTPAEVLELISVLEDRAEIFDALGDPGHSFWAERPEAVPYIRELSLFRVRQTTPLLFAAFEKLDFESFVKVLKLTSVISFRYSVISSLNTNELEPIYHLAAKAVLEGNAQSARDVFDVLRPIYVSDEKFIADFAQRSISTAGQRKKVAKYILCRLEEGASGKPCDFETDSGTIEHILPENPSDEWEGSIDRKKWNEVIYRIGNLTLLAASANRDLGSKVFSEKVPVYRNSQYLLTQNLAKREIDDWTIPQLDDRQKYLARQAASIWRVDFA